MREPELDLEPPEERAVVAEARRLLRDGPRAVDDLVDRLVASGVTDALGAAPEHLHDEVIAVLLDADGVWLTTDAAVAIDTGQRVATATFTHRLTEAELASGTIRLFPDLVALDRGAGVDATELALVVDGAPAGTVRIVPDDLLEPGEEHTHLVGAPGWLAAFAPGDAVAFVRRDDALELRAAEPKAGAGGREAQLLREAHEALSEGRGGGVWLFAVVLEALAGNDHAFRQPVRPIAELVADEGFALERGRMGPAGTDFVEQARRDDVAELATSLHRLDACCLDAFDLARDAYEAHAAGETVEPTRELAQAIGHGEVASALVAFVHGCDEDDGLVTLASFAEPFAEQHGRTRAGGALLLSHVCEETGQAATAVSLAEEAVLADPGFDVAVEHLARLVELGGNLESAVRLRRQLDHEDDPDLQFLLTLVPPRRTDIGRNDPCPCGSGKKYKACCLNRPAPLTAAQRARWLDHKLGRFALRPAHLPRLVSVSFTALGGPPIDGFVDSGVPISWVLFDDGLARDFAARYAEVLPAEEQEMLAAWCASTRGLYEIEEVERRTSVTVRDVHTGERHVVADAQAAVDFPVGQLITAHVGHAGDEGRFVSVALPVEEVHRAVTAELLATRPDAFAMARWYLETDDGYAAG